MPPLWIDSILFDSFVPPQPLMITPGGSTPCRAPMPAAGMVNL